MSRPSKGFVCVRNDTYLGYANSKKFNFSQIMWSTHREDAAVFRDAHEASIQAHAFKGCIVRSLGDPIITLGEKLAAELAANPKGTNAMSTKKESTSTRPKLYDHSIYKVGKCLGAKGYSAPQFKKLLEHHDLLGALSASSIPTAISDGKSVNYSGALPELSKSAWAEIKSVCGAPGADVEAPAPAKKPVAKKAAAAPKAAAPAPAKKPVAKKKAKAA